MYNSSPRLIFWEATKCCNLNCKHCRAVPVKPGSVVPKEGELTFLEARNLIDQICEFERTPIFVISGGEPLYRNDIFDIILYAKNKQIQVAVATNGTLITDKVAKELLKSGTKRVSVSLDGAVQHTHDDFRSQKGAFNLTIKGLNYLRENGLSTQINFTVTKHNISEVKELLNLAKRYKVDAVHLFFMVPVGCGQVIPEDYKLTSEETENILIWIYDQSKKVPFYLKQTCAPQYYRLLKQKGERVPNYARGCLAGSGICFVSNTGELFPCGYLPVSVGNILKNSIKKLWDGSDVFGQIRTTHLLKGKCKVCKYRDVCMGCRARAYAETGDYMEEEPLCAYQQ